MFEVLVDRKSPCTMTPKRLLVVARVTHYRHNGRFWAYTPYAREIDIWADMFAEVRIAGTLIEEVPPGDCSPFDRPNVAVLPVAEAGGDGWKAKLKQVFMIPQILRQLHGYMREADAIHARCPCDLGLLGILLGRFYSRCLIAKYATQWQPYPAEPWTWRLQRIILRSRWWPGPVTVYGEWPDQPEKIVPFFTSMLTDEQIMRAQSAVTTHPKPNRFRILFVGRLSTSKNVHVLLETVASLHPAVRNLECVIVGEGPERIALEKLSETLGIQHRITFAGGVSFEAVIEHYERSDVLVLASEIEGWPKAIAEGMAFGLVCIGTACGMVPQMLGKGRGLMVSPGSVTELRDALLWMAENPTEANCMRIEAAKWAQKYSLEGLREALRNLMSDRWGNGEIPLPSMKRDSLPARM